MNIINSYDFQINIDLLYYHIIINYNIIITTQRLTTQNQKLAGVSIWIHQH